ncbi:hypothetical protein AB0L75_28360 [Streptomyces sp. NPDC052101]|uniref:hypothetical protein n=1 Tax=Streptomyces sp. NPDC052101 TaxID=3155763 RepID=UPI00341DD2AA
MHDPIHDTGFDSFAAVLADELPGTWTSQYHPGTAPDDVTAQVWDLNEVADALARHRVRAHALLTSAEGTRLFVTDAPRRRDSYLVAAMAPQGVPAEAFRGVREPDGITVAADPLRAAEDIAYELLPRYDKALARVRRNAARLAPTPAAPGDHVVMTWSGDAIVVDRPEQRPDIELALVVHGFKLDVAKNAYFLSGDDTALQAASVRGAGRRLSEMGIGVVLRNPPAKPALDTIAVAPVAPTAAAPHRSR